MARAKERPEQRFEFEGIDAAHWRQIQERSKECFKPGFLDDAGQTGSEFCVSWRYVRAAKLVMFRVISWPKSLGGHYPGQFLAGLVYGFPEKPKPGNRVIERSEGSGK